MRITALVVVVFYTITAHAAPPATEVHLKAGALSAAMLRPDTSSAAVLIIPGSFTPDSEDSAAGFHFQSHQPQPPE